MKSPPKEIIWDVEDLEKNPPCGTHISKDITSLAQYFVIADGKNLISVLEEDVDIEIKVL